MARMTKESLEAKIKKAEEKVARTGRSYNEACDELKELRDKMAAIENEVLVEAFIKSSKTLEEARLIRDRHVSFAKWFHDDYFSRHELQLNKK